MSTVTKSSFMPARLMDGSSNGGIVGIFWDYESCPSPSKQSLEPTLKTIETLSKSYGPIRAFNVYIDLNRHPEARKAAGIRQQLHSSGVSVLDCPGNGKRVADKTIIVDLFAFALRNRTSGTLIVLSTDPDLAYTLSLLRQRMFQVTLVTSKAVLGDSTSALRSQADTCFTWSNSSVGNILTPIDIGEASRFSASTSSLAPKQVVPSPLGLPLSVSVAPAATIAVPNQPHLILASQTSNVLPSSLITPRETRIVSQMATSPMLSNTRISTGQVGSSLPPHLQELVTVLREATKARGWPLEQIYYVLKLKSRMQLDMDTVNGYLTEAVQRGIAVQSVGLSKKAKRELTYFAVNERYFR
ncbi:hypothetical protein FRB90_010792 [Tulasnella sp. 427]|nr:hypothetical protein FRB90_010792 [Tulasnella sp. 427]